MIRVIDPTQRRGRATQRRILEATEGLMAGKPFHRLSVAEIARAAGISVGNFYNRFADKQALLLELYRVYEVERTERIFEELRAERWQAASLNESVEALVDVVVDFFSDRRHLIRSYVLYFRTHPEKASEQAHERLRELATAFVERLQGAASREERELSTRRARLVYQFVLALAREMVLFADDPSKRALETSRAQLKREIADAARGYLAVAGSGSNRR